MYNLKYSYSFCFLNTRMCFIAHDDLASLALIKDHGFIYEWRATSAKDLCSSRFFWMLTCRLGAHLSPFRLHSVEEWTQLIFRIVLCSKSQPWADPALQLLLMLIPGALYSQPEVHFPAWFTNSFETMQDFDTIIHFFFLFSLIKNEEVAPMSLLHPFLWYLSILLAESRLSKYACQDITGRPWLHRNEFIDRKIGKTGSHGIRILSWRKWYKG